MSKFLDDTGLKALMKKIKGGFWTKDEVFSAETSSMLGECNSPDKAIRRTVYQTNPNLLDNWYFVNPVNQRGKDSYTGVNTDNLYGIDRWKMQERAATVAVTADGVTVSNTAICYFIQLIENPARIMGKQVTLSVLRADGELVTATSVATEQAASGAVTSSLNAGKSGNCYLFQYSKAPLTVGFAIETQANENKTYIAAKLELGSAQTLAHKEGDVWVLNEIPDYGIELMKCMRYFQTFQTESLRPAADKPEDYRPPLRANATHNTITVKKTVGTQQQDVTLYTASAEPY